MIPADVANKILRLGKEGHTIREIVTMTGVCQKTVWTYLKNHEIHNSKRRPRRHKFDDKIIELFKQGQSISEIQQNLGCSNTTVYNVLRAANFTWEGPPMVRRGEYLSSDEIFIIKTRYSMDHMPKLTLDEMAKEMGLSRQRVHQLQLRAEQKIGIKAIQQVITGKLSTKIMMAFLTKKEK